jgi:hypothetical protein
LTTELFELPFEIVGDSESERAHVIHCITLTGQVQYVAKQR